METVVAFEEFMAAVELLCDIACEEGGVFVNFDDPSDREFEAAMSRLEDLDLGPLAERIRLGRRMGRGSL
jgi:hypothetical protein